MSSLVLVLVLNGVLGLELVYIRPELPFWLMVALLLNYLSNVGLDKEFYSSRSFYSNHEGDVIITSYWNARDLDNIICVLHVFYYASGLRINIHKSNIYGIGVSTDDVSIMARNSGGCLTLIKAVLGSLGIYYSSISKVPEMSRTNLGVRNLAYLRKMLIETSLADINDVENSCVWTIGIDGKFIVGDSCHIIDFKIFPSLVPLTTWDKTLPRKVNNFIWRMTLDRLPHRLNLSSHDIDILIISCSSCNGNVESSNHIFFECDIDMEVWRLVHNWCDIPFPPFTSFEHWNNWSGLWHGSKEKKHHISVIFASSLWWV
ncbi:RNA-directed DNA polymerase, eukaryota [Tanacetum coccineum]